MDDDDEIFKQLIPYRNSVNVDKTHKKDMEEIYKEINLLNKMFQDIDTLIIEQGENMDKIEQNIEKTKVLINESENELQMIEINDYSSVYKYKIITFGFGMISLGLSVLGIKFGKYF